MNRMKKQLSAVGFTLVEVLIAITVLGILSGIVYYVTVGRSNERAKFNATISDLTQVGQAAKIYLAANNAYPADAVSGVSPSGFSQYVSSWPKGQWAGSQYDYEYWTDGSGNPVVQVVLRFCDTGGACARPTGAWSSPVSSNGTMIYCVTGNCISTVKAAPAAMPNTKTATVQSGICVGGNTTSTTLPCTTPKFQ